jgi:predicted hotdog family 3-hydroxylacyl-ACP dehydratase
MRLLDRVLSHSRDCTRCAADPAASAVLAHPDGSVPAWIGLEYMAQCIAVHGGLAARASGVAPKVGVLLGARRLEVGARDLAPGTELVVEARHHAGESGLVAFDCAVSVAADGAPLVRGRLNVYILESFRDLPRGGGSDGTHDGAG